MDDLTRHIQSLCEMLLDDDTVLTAEAKKGIISENRKTEGSFRI